MVIPGSDLDGDVRIQFFATSDGAWSDQDGLWPTAGHFVVDSIVVVDATGTLDFENFEDEAVGAFATNDGNWTALTPVSFGDFAALYPGATLLQEDPCINNISFMWAFINGSTETYAGGGYPEQIAVPKSMPGEFGRSLYMNNEIWSPPMDWASDINGAPVPATASAVRLEFDAYEDLPLENLMLFAWFVRSLFAGCGSRWETDNFVYFSDTPGCFENVSIWGRTYCLASISFR